MHIYLHKNFAACPHFVTSSDLLFNKKRLSVFKISSFSIVHKLHELLPLVYGLACLTQRKSILVWPRANLKLDLTIIYTLSTTRSMQLVLHCQDTFGIWRIKMKIIALNGQFLSMPGHTRAGAIHATCVQWKSCWF